MKTTFALLLAALISTPVGAVESLWPGVIPAPYSAITLQSGHCDRQPPAPYTGALQLQSKYDQSDASKSTLRLWTSRETRAVSDQIKQYIGGLIEFSNRFQRAKKDRDAAQSLACISLWLDSWAKASALESPDASKTGVAARKWALAAIGATLLKTRALSGNEFQLNAEQSAWLQRLADIVIAEYEPRRTPRFEGFNNHDYWAGWAVATVAMLSGRDDYLQWADGSLEHAFDQMIIAPSGDYAYLPREVARGKLGADYTHYALVPLMLLVEARETNGHPLSAEQREKIQLLANFAARGVLQPSTLSELQRGQKTVSSHKMIWLIPFLNRYPDHAWARALYKDQGGNVDNYSQIGGRIKPLYPALQK